MSQSSRDSRKTKAPRSIKAGQRARRRLLMEQLEDRRMLNADFQLLQDINPSSKNDGSAPADFISVGNQVFFTASTPTKGRELWVSNGADDGTRIVKDITVGVESSTIQDLTVADGKLFFIANSQLWMTDGTDGGTTQVLDAPVYSRDGSNLVEFEGQVYFSANVASTGTQWRLMKTDGTQPGTSVVLDGNISAAHLTVVGNQFFFNSSQQLWASDGTAEGTQRVVSSTVAQRPENLTRVVKTDELGQVSEKLFFTAQDSTHGFELWVSDGTDIGTFMVKDINTGSDTNTRDVSELTDVNGVLYFRADDGVNGAELWKSDGTLDGTEMVENIHPTGDSNPSWLTSHEGTLFFIADDGTHAFELWKSDGTAATTELVKDINDTNDGSYFSTRPSDLTSFAGKLYFNASNGGRYYGSDNGNELWVSDGTEAGTQLAVEFYNGVKGGFPTGISVASLPGIDGAIEETLVFSAQNSQTGPELWKSDGTQAGTFLVQDIVGGTGNSNPLYLTESGGLLYFSASTQSPPEHRELWVSDGTQDGTYLLKDVWNGSSSSPRSLTDVDGRLFFVATGSEGSFRVGAELYTSDGTPGGTVLVKDINAQPATYGSGNSLPDELTPVGNTLYFTADDGTLGTNGNRELWKSDGTEAGTVVVKDFTPAADGLTSAN